MKTEDPTEYGLTHAQAEAFNGSTDELADLADDLDIDLKGIEPYGRYYRKAIREALLSRVRRVDTPST